MYLKLFFLSLLISFSIMSYNSAQNALIIGHRGSSYTMPENTVISAVKAWEEGADAVEIDVYPTADGKVAVVHDKSTKRTTGEDYLVTETTSVVLSTLDAGKWKGKQFEGEHLPMLTEVINAIPRYKDLVVEVKSGPEIIPILKKILENHPKKSQIIFIAFGWDVITQLKKTFPTIPAFWLSGNKNEVEDKWLDLKKVGLDGINLHYSIVDEDLIKKAHNEGLGIMCWTVNDIDIAKNLIEIGIDGITTDRPGYLRSRLLSEIDFEK